MCASPSSPPDPSIGTTVSNYGCSQDYNIIQKLGEGCSGRVYQARGSEDGHLYALKKFTAEDLSEVDDVQDVFQAEVNKLHQLEGSDCPYHARMKESFTETGAPPLYLFPRHWIVLRYADRGNLDGEM